MSSAAHSPREHRSEAGPRYRSAVGELAALHPRALLTEEVFRMAAVVLRADARAAMITHDYDHLRAVLDGVTEDVCAYMGLMSAAHTARPSGRQAPPNVSIHDIMPVESGPESERVAGPPSLRVLGGGAEPRGMSVSSGAEGYESTVILPLCAVDGEGNRTPRHTFLTGGV